MVTLFCSFSVVPHSFQEGRDKVESYYFRVVSTSQNPSVLHFIKASDYAVGL